MIVDIGPNTLAAIVALVSLGCSVVALLRARENTTAIQQHDVRLDALSATTQQVVNVMHSHDGRSA